MTDGQAADAVLAWLSEMEACVRTRDYARGRAIFAPEVRAFGSRGGRLDGLDNLETDQWRRVWGTIQSFTFDRAALVWGAGGPDLLWLACPWNSARPGADGALQPRPGRMTAVLARRGGRWLAVHTHHSVAASEPG